MEEYTKFIFLKIKEHDVDATKLSPSSVIDEVWHYHMLMAKKYRDFNNRIYGLTKYFIDHNPEGGRDVESRKQRIDYTISRYNVYFGEIQRRKIWDLREKISLTDEDIQRRQVASRKDKIILGKTMNGQILKIPIDLHEFGDYVEDLKYVVESITGIPVDQQRLVFNGKQLEDSLKLCKYGIIDNSLIYIIIRLKGC